MTKTLLSSDVIQARTHIRKAWMYNAHARNMASCNHAYMGGMASHSLKMIIGTDDFSLASLKKVPGDKLIKGSEYLETSGFPWYKVKDVKLSEEKVATNKKIQEKKNPKKGAFACNEVTKQGYEDLIFLCQQIVVMEYHQDHDKIAEIRKRYGIGY